MKNSFFFILAMFYSGSAIAQIDCDRRQLRKNNKAIHQQLEFQKQNATVVNLSDDFISKIKKIKRFKKTYELLNPNNKSVHFLELKTTSKVQVNNTRCKKTYGLKSEASGVVLPKISLLLPQLEPYSLYKDRINIAGVNYLSPLYNPKFYFITQELNDSTTVLNFKPKYDKKYLLEGHLILKNSNKQLLYFNAHSVVKAKTSIEYQAEKVNEIYLPSSLFTTLEIGKNHEITIVSNSSFEKYKHLDTDLKCSSVIIDNDTEMENGKQINILSPLLKWKDKNFSITQKVVNTLLEQNKTQKIFDDIYTVAQGEIPYKVVNFKLNKLLNFNQYEGIRLGLGATTNELFHHKISVGGYTGYGFKDKKLKYGVNFNYMLDNISKTYFSLEYENNLSEPGEVKFLFSNKAFGNESYRKYGLEFIERRENLAIHFNTKKLKWITYNIHYKKGQIEPFYNYNYTFLNQNNLYNYDIFSSTIRFVPREKFMKTFGKLISLGSKYPAFWINYELGSIEQTSFSKINFKPYFL